MTKTKVDAASSTHFVSAKDKRLRSKMETESGRETSDVVQSITQEKKKPHRAPSPARPKDVPGWSITKIRGGIGTPTLSVKPGAIHLGSRLSRRSPISSKETKDKMGKSPGKSALSALGATKSSVKSNKAARRKVSDASNASDDLSKDSGKDSGKLSPTDSSSELSDCGSEENKLSTSSDRESSSRGGGTESESAAAEQSTAGAGRYGERLALGGDAGQDSTSPGDERSLTSLDSRMPASTSLAFSDLNEDLTEAMHEEYLREIEELRSENDYLKDEVEELRSEMLEMRDMYMEEDVYQLQELRQQLEQTNKTCRILQYRLRKAERRSLRVAQTGQVDGELIRTLEQDVKVAKDVSIRLHNELDTVEKKRSRLEQENEELQVKLQDLEVAKQVLQAELEKSRENSLKKRGPRPNHKPDKKTSPQPPEDNSDLKCQLHFAKEESALMCKKLAKMVKDNEAMKEELTKYRSVYGDIDTSLTVDEVADSPHTREAEVRVHLKLVEEEANLLSRRIVELEVENRGLRAEMDDMKIQETSGGLAVGTGVGQLLISPSVENVMEMQRHLQFVEEEADLLRRSLIEMEEQNKLLMNELNRYKSELPPDSDNESLSPSTILPPSITTGVAASEEGSLNEASQEELLGARLQISDLSSKVKKLQYENRILLSNLQRCDLASRHVDIRLALETDAEAGDSAECVPSPDCNDSPIDGEEIQPLEEKSEKVTGNNHSDQCLNIKELLAIRDQAQLITSAIQLLMSADSNCLLAFSSDTILHKITAREPGEAGLLEKNQVQNSNLTLVEAVHSRLQSLQAQLLALSQRIEVLGETPDYEHVKGLSTFALVSQSAEPSPVDTQVNQITVQQKLLEQVCELQTQLCEAKEKAKKTQEDLGLENLAHHDYTQSYSQKLSQLQEEHKKVLVQRDFQLQSMSLQTRLQQKFWSQEKNVLVQESQQLKQILLLVSLKLRWLLKQWRLGKKFDAEVKDMLQINSIKELHHPLEDDGVAPHHGDNKMAASKEQPPSPTKKDRSLSDNNLQQASGLSTTLSDLKVALQDLSTELREERQSSQELTQQFARAKASWEVERTELKSLITQLEGKAGKMSATGTDMDPPDLKAALKRECEEHQNLLADSYAAVMDLTKQLQISERNWSREKLELLEHFNQERNQWEQRLLDAQSKSPSAKGISTDATTNETTLQRTQLISSLSDLESLLDVSSFLPDHEVNGIAEVKAGKHQFNDLVTRTDLRDLNQKNWKYLSSESASLEKTEPFKTWDCPSTGIPELKLSMEHVQRSYTAPDKTGIRIYYSPPTVRRMERKVKDLSLNDTQLGLKFFDAPNSDQAILPPTTQTSPSHLSASYEQWLSSLSQQHRDLLEGRTGSSGALHTLEISANLSDDMKEMTNCVRQAIRSSSLERKSSKDAGSQTVGFTSTGTQTAKFVSVGLQTESPASSTSRGAGFHGKIWSPRPSTSLTSARSRQISSSLEKVHGRIDRPCCSPKYGSPKLTRRVSASSSSSKLETSSTSSRDRSMWNLPNRSIAQSGSAWARSTTTRDSPVLSGLNDGLSSLFSVVEHTSSMESLCRGDTCPGRQAAGKPSCPSVGIMLGDSGTQKYGIVQEFFQNVCVQTLSGEKTGAIDEPKPECLSGALMGTDSVTKIVNKRFMRQTLRDEAVVSGKESAAGASSPEHCLNPPGHGVHQSVTGCHWSPLPLLHDDTTELVDVRDLVLLQLPFEDAPHVVLEDSSCDCKSQSPTSCLARSSRTTVRGAHSQCKHRVQETALGNEERLDVSNE
ncbi:protein SOGA1 isoform X4 [Tachysurus fulvidraco]|uniref:protein SOGA1 isoform X4 n=1 Tax=Tachysurus fulvidraco TaxID=1234273 RepID=UPI001FEDFB9B|nr:protein SOGA1 isoform X4 [Tachysurus fulvidraco]